MGSETFSRWVQALSTDLPPCEFCEFGELFSAQKILPGGHLEGRFFVSANCPSIEAFDDPFGDHFTTDA